MVSLRLETMLLMASMTSVLNEVVDVTGVAITENQGEVDVHFAWFGNVEGSCRISQSSMQAITNYVLFELVWAGGDRRLDRCFRVSEGEGPILAFIREHMN